MPEDPVTGSYHCALAPYWSRRLEGLQAGEEIVGVQGGKRRGEIRCVWLEKEERVLLRGNAVEGELLTLQCESSALMYSSIYSRFRYHAVGMNVFAMSKSSIQQYYRSCHTIDSIHRFETQIHILGRFTFRSLIFGATFGIPSLLLLVTTTGPRFLCRLDPLQSICSGDGELAIFRIPPHVHMISRYAKLVVSNLYSSRMPLSELAPCR